MNPRTHIPDRKDLPILAVFGALLLVWNIISWSFPFFWDTVLNSRIAHFYLESGFSSLTVPEAIDAGHPPFFGLYLALVWKTFGRSLWLAHLAMLPFLWLLMVQYYKLAKRWLSPNLRVWAMMLLFCEPTFLAQSSMVSPDIVLVAGYLLALNAILDRNRKILALAMIPMALVSMRGILALPAVVATDYLLARFACADKPNWRGILAYLPVSGMVLIWFLLHYRAVGWLLSPPMETYGEHRQLLGFAGILRNLGITGWRFLDFGRVFLWIFVIAGGFRLGWRSFIKDQENLVPVIAFLVPACLFTLLFIPFSNPIGHRYFLVCYLILGMIALRMVDFSESQLRGKVAMVAVMLGLVAGNLWIYPPAIAQGWDSSLAHINYFPLERQLRDFLTTEGINPSEVCTKFPLSADPYLSKVLPYRGNPNRVPLNSGDPGNAMPGHGKPGRALQDQQITAFPDLNDIGEQCGGYVLYSNISNGFSALERDDLESSGGWKYVWGHNKGGILMQLYKKSDDRE